MGTLSLFLFLNANFLFAGDQIGDLIPAVIKNSTSLLNISDSHTILQKPHRPIYATGASVRIEGNYVSRAIEGSDDSCDISVEIIKVKNLYRYKLYVAGTTYKGILKVLHGEKPEARYLIFTGITWAVNEGDISQLKEDEEPQSLKLPVGVRAVLLNNEIMIQNSGNAMNHYVQLNACDQKYIRMVKQ
ncbi:hypothetical protein [Pedobacter sp. WC2423]|uniref:hypothetical protein n=1 Tax=Pedobacter sp. WC2423 TaxID=3234142 RepID=UPI003465E5E3